MQDVGEESVSAGSVESPALTARRPRAIRREEEILADVPSRFERVPVSQAVGRVSPCSGDNGDQGLEEEAAQSRAPAAHGTPPMRCWRRQRSR